MELNADLAFTRQRSMLIVNKQLPLAISMTLMIPINVNQFFTCGQQLDVEKKYLMLVPHHPVPHHPVPHHRRHPAL